MNKPIISTLFILFFFTSILSYAKPYIVTTTTNLKSIAQQIGGNKVDVYSFSKGTQDPHYLEAKPSYMVKAAKADLLISIGLGLEDAWLPLILRGARNTKLKNSGHLIAGNFVKTIGKLSGKISRSEGDVHPEGNPHILLAPENAITIAKKITDSLITLTPSHSNYYKNNLKSFSMNLRKKIKEWERRVGKNKKVITYHKTLTYFFRSFSIKNISILEPKPGVPPTAKHTLKVMKFAKLEGVRLALIENYFSPIIAKRVAREIKGFKVVLAPVAVGGEASLTNLNQLYEKLISIIEAQ